MRKEKYDKKCKELIVYEENTLKRAIAFTEPMKEKLSENGLKVRIKLYWSDDGHYSEEASSERKEIKSGYICFMCISICKEFEDPDDFDLLHICDLFSITRVAFIRPFHFFFKDSIDKMLKRVQNNYEQILLKGYGQVLEELKKRSKWKEPLT